MQVQRRERAPRRADWKRSGRHPERWIRWAIGTLLLALLGVAPAAADESPLMATSR